MWNDITQIINLFQLLVLIIHITDTMFLLKNFLPTDTLYVSNET